jgi:hypothetical protein
MVTYIIHTFKNDGDDSFIHLFTIHKSDTQSQRQIGCGFGQKKHIH